MLRSAVLVLLSFASVCLSLKNIQITDFAVPSEVKRGENVELQCRFTAVDPRQVYVKWWQRRQEFGVAHLIYQRLQGYAPQLHEKFRAISEIKGNDTLLLMNLQPKDSAVYECEVSDLNEEIRKAGELTVYTGGSGPELNITNAPDGPDEGEGDDAVITCSATEVAPKPVLVVFVDGKEFEPSNEFLSDPVDSMYDIAVKLVVDQEDLDEREVRCELFYENGNLTHEAFVDTETYMRSGAPPADEEPESVAPLQFTHDNSTSTSNTPRASWALPLLAVVAALRLTHHCLQPM